MKLDILIIGTGSLAKATTYALSSVLGTNLKVCIVSRDLQNATGVALIANARSSCFESNVQFFADVIVWEEKFLQSLLEKHQPKVILHLSSLQSAWEFQDSSSGWSQLINQVGYGCTIPFQARLASDIALAVKKTGLQTSLINGCYPDVVNALLKKKGLDVLCGIGNIAILSKGFPPLKDLKILGSHYHLTKSFDQLHKENNSLKAWQGEKPLTVDPKWFNPFSSIKGMELNQLTGAIAAQFLRDLFGDQSKLHHVPGPFGLHGGFPVEISKAGIKIELPESLSLEDASALNKAWSYMDGVVVEENGFVRFNSTVACELGKLHNKYADGFFVDNLNSVCDYFINFREALRNQ